MIHRMNIPRYQIHFDDFVRYVTNRNRPHPEPKECYIIMALANTPLVFTSNFPRCHAERVKRYYLNDWALNIICRAFDTLVSTYPIR